MIIKGSDHAAGLNLQEAHIGCVAHYPANNSILTQLTGRIVRNGRTTNPSIRFICYPNEKIKINNM